MQIKRTTNKGLYPTQIGTAAKSLGHNLPSATEFRKEIEICNKRQEGQVRDAVSRALAHSLSTAQQYYHAPTLSDTFETYRGIDEIMRGERARSPKVEKAKEKEVKASSCDTEEQRDSYLQDDRESGEQTEEKGKGKKKGKGKGKERKSWQEIVTGGRATWRKRVQR